MLDAVCAIHVGEQVQEVVVVWGLTLGVVVWPGPICKEPEHSQCRSLVCAMKLQHSPR